MRNFLVATKLVGAVPTHYFPVSLCNASFSYLGFLSQTPTIHGTAGEGMDLLYSSVPLPPALPTLIYKFVTTITTAKKYFCLKAIYGGCPSTLSVVSQDL